jgi:hypothetical protein
MPLQLNCVNCQQPFYCHPSEAEKGRKYCSTECRSRHLHKKGPSAESRTPVDFTCKECGKAFVMMKTYLRAYQKKHGKDPLYCSIDCSKIGRRRDADERNKLTCQHCGKLEYRSRTTEKFRIYRQQKYCSVECKDAAIKTNALDRFNGGQVGRHVKRHGYVYLSLPALASPTGKRTAVLEHRYVMEQKLGRPLTKDETVHHVNGIRGDNSPINLELFNSRHGPGQRVTDKVQFAIEILTQYPEFCAAAGYSVPEKLHATDRSENRATPAPPSGQPPSHSDPS